MIADLARSHQITRDCEIKGRDEEIMAEVSNLGAGVMKQLMVEAGGRFSDDLARKLHRRIAVFRY
jgi:hypothetical protein